MASPKGNSAETEMAEMLEEVTQGESYDERASAVFRSLESGIEPSVVNKAYNAPKKSDDQEDSETAEEQPEEAAGESADDEAKQETEPEKAKSIPDGDTQKHEQLLIAKQVLRRDNLTDDDFKLLGEDRIIELAEKRAEAHKAIDHRFFQTKAEPSENDKNTSDSLNAEDQQDDSIELIREFDDELAEKVEARLKSIVSKNEQLERELAQSRFQVVVDNAKVKFPELKDQSVLNIVLDKANQLALSPAYTSAEDAMRDACELVLSGRREQAAQESLLKSNRTQRAGQIDTDTVIDDSKKPMNKDQKESLAFKLLEQGLSDREVQAKLAKIPDA